MQKKYNVIFCLLFFKLCAQTSFTPQLEKIYDIPQETYQASIGQFFKNNIANEYKELQYNITTSDFGLKKDRPVKDLSIDTNKDGKPEYFYQFNQDGTISHLDDYVDNHKRSYTYVDNMIVIKDEPITLYKNHVSFTSIDSVFFDHNKNIVKELYLSKIHDMAERDNFKKVVEYQFSNTNQLEKKYYYSNKKGNGNSPDFTEVREIYYNNCKDSIVEKEYYTCGQKLQVIRNIDKNNNFSSKSIYYLNDSNIVNRIKIFYRNLDLRHDFFIDYDKSGRIISYKDRDQESGYFEYNKDGRISQIKNTYGKEPPRIFDYTYDKNGRYLFCKKKGDKEQNNPRFFTYEEFGNWATVTWETDYGGVKYTNLITRTISYY